MAVVDTGSNLAYTDEAYTTTITPKAATAAAMYVITGWSLMVKADTDVKMAIKIGTTLIASFFPTTTGVPIQAWTCTGRWSTGANNEAITIEGGGTNGKIHGYIQYTKIGGA